MSGPRLSPTQMQAGLFPAFAYEQIAVTSAVKSLTVATYTDSDNRFAKRAIITVEDAKLRYRYDGGDPSTTVGHLLNRGDVLILVGTSNIKNFRVTKVGTTDAEINISYE